MVLAGLSAPLAQRLYDGGYADRFRLAASADEALDNT
jgi:hypothetical protein